MAEGTEIPTTPTNIIPFKPAEPAKQEPPTDPTKIYQDLANSLATVLQLKTAAARIAMFYALQFVKVFDIKHQGYGPDSINRHGEHGVLIRLDEKVARILKAVKSGHESPDEKVQDNWMDIAIYGVMGFMLRVGAWPR